MQETNCYLCNSNNRTKLFNQQGTDDYLHLLNKSIKITELSWYYCEDCGFSYRSPTLTREEYKTLYKNYHKIVFSQEDPDEHFWKIINIPENKSENRQKIKWLKNILYSKFPGQFNDSNWSILDVGCGSGTLLYALNKQMEPKKICGVEPNIEYANLANRHVNGKIVNSEYDSGLFQNQFDLAIITKVLEHLLDPIDLLCKLRKDMRHGGIIFIEVPHIKDMVTFSPASDRFTIPHLYYYDQWTMQRVLHQCGWGMKEHRVITTPRDRSYLQIVAQRKDEAASTHLGQQPYWPDKIR